MHFFLLIRLLSVKFTDPRGQYLREYKKTFFHPESLINGYFFLSSYTFPDYLTSSYKPELLLLLK